MFLSCAMFPCCVSWFHNINYVMEHGHISFLYLPSSHETFPYEGGVGTLCSFAWFCNIRLLEFN